MFAEFRNSLRRQWPAMEGVSMTIRADNVYRTYATGQDPATLFKKAISYMDSAKSIPRNEEQQNLLNHEVEDMTMHAIFGSNRIEHAGLNLDVTIHLCRRILHGEDVGEIDERTPEYVAKLAEVFKLDPLLHAQPLKFVIRGRQEIIQHVKAFQHLIHHFAIEKEPMTEELIKETHKILCKGVPVVHREGPETPSEGYSGLYRTVVVEAGNSNFVVPQHVPSKMTKLCADLKEEMDKAEKDIRKWTHVSNDTQRHSFPVYWNFVAIGERESDRDEYMDIKKRSSATMEGHGEYATFVLDKGMKSFRKMRQKLHGKKK